MTQKPWDKNLQLLLALIVGLNVAPHVSMIPTWVTAVASFCIFWKVLYLTRGVPLPKRWILWIATLGVTVGCYYSYQTLFGQEAAGALLVMMASLKLLETNRYRDAMLVIFTSYFLLMSHLLASQSLASTVFMVADVLIVTALMFQVHRRDHQSSPRSFKPAARLLALALPLWVFLFFVFPRFSTGLWNSQSTTAGTGFSDNLDPGSISKLTDSDEPAFRVEFKDGAKRPQTSLYWRGAILSQGAGLKWQKARTLLPDVRLRDAAPREPIAYDVYLETGFQKWIFVLDYPLSFTSSDQGLLSGVSARPGFTYESSRDVSTRATYSARAILEAPVQRLPQSQLAQYLSVPETTSARVRALAESLKAKTDLTTPSDKSPEERFALTAANWFVDNGFRYTKTPGALSTADGVAQLDQFLFETRVGFCEHYAAALASLTRAMGVASRVVVGFQGGAPNEFGGYLIVRKLDAHAWTEIWVSDPKTRAQGHWVRLDPTGLIAPLRLRLGGDFNRIDLAALGANATDEEYRSSLQGGFAGVFLRAQYLWDTVQMRWNAFLLNYDFESQSRFLRNLGFKGSVYIAMLGLAAAGLLVFALIFLWRARRRAHQPDPLLRDWQKFCRSLEHAGVKRNLNEGPLDFARRAAAAFPSRAEDIQHIALAFTELRYGRAPTKNASFHQSVRRFSIKAKSRPVSS